MVLSDDFLVAIALDFNDEQNQQAAQFIKGLLPVVQAQDYRRVFRYVQETGLPDGVTDTTVIVRLRPKPVAWRVHTVSWNNGQPGSAAQLLMSTDRKDPDAPNAFIHQGRATIGQGRTELVVGPQAFSMATSFDNERPFQIFVPSAAELRFDLTKVGGGLLEAGSQVLQMVVEELPPERDYERFKAQTVLVS